MKNSMRTMTTLVGAGAVLASGATTLTTSANAAQAYVNTTTNAKSATVGQSVFLTGTTNAMVGEKVCSEVVVGSRWSTSQCSTVASDHTFKIEMTYGKTTAGTYSFHAVIGGIASPTVKLTRTASSTTTPTNPSTSGYIKGRTTNGYTLYSGYNGSKVYLVQKALGIPTNPMSSTMGYTTTSKVMAFQRAHGIKANGVVDANTFYALKDLAPYKSYLAGYNFDVDVWAAPATVSSSASRATRVNAMVAFAKAQLGKPYVWGGTGPMGYDCAGILIQAMRAGGYNPKNLSNFINVRPSSDLSNQMMRDGELPKGSLSNLQVGDFIYYGGSNGVAHHVTMYVGNNTVINAVDSKVQYASLSNNFGWGRKLGVNRMP